MLREEIEIMSKSEIENKFVKKKSYYQRQFGKYETQLIDFKLEPYFGKKVEVETKIPFGSKWEKKYIKGTDIQVPNHALI